MAGWVSAGLQMTNSQTELQGLMRTTATRDYTSANTPHNDEGRNEHSTHLPLSVRCINRHNGRKRQKLVMCVMCSGVKRFQPHRVGPKDGAAIRAKQKNRAVPLNV